MPINIIERCPVCGECCVEGCFGELKCALECCGCCTVEVMFGPNQTIYYGTIMAQNQADGFFYAYDPTNDALDIPRGILRYTVKTDENGYLTKYAAPIIGSLCNRNVSNMYYCGTFKTQEIRGNLAAALAHPNFSASLVKGTAYSNGLLRLG